MKKLQKMSIGIIVFFMLFSSQTLAAKIVIDPGHGGSDPGAIGVNGLREKEVNMDISLKLQEELMKRGYVAILTHNEDKTMSLEERVQFKEEQEADLFVSIHANSFHNSTIKGSLVLYYDHRYPQRRYPASEAMKALSPQNRQLAQYVLDGLVAEAGTVDRGVVTSSVYVARMGTMPSILVETAFLSNWDDVTLLSNKKERKKMAAGIANGVEKFISPDGFIDISGHWANESILRLKNKGIVLGKKARFSPERPLTRAEFLTMMDRVFNFSSQEAEPAEDLTKESVQQPMGGLIENPDEPVKEQAEETTEIENVKDFTDLEQTHWAYSVLKKALFNGYIDGYPDGTVRPNQAITRAEVSVLFDRIWKQKQEHSDAPLIIRLFNDVPKNIWFSQAVYRLKAANIIHGITKNSFVPDRFMSRAEIAVMIDRYLELGA